MSSKRELKQQRKDLYRQSQDASNKGDLQGMSPEHLLIESKLALGKKVHNKGSFDQGWDWVLLGGILAILGGTHSFFDWRAGQLQPFWLGLFALGGSAMLSRTVQRLLAGGTMVILGLLSLAFVAAIVYFLKNC